jgi:hypothetical protein
MTIPSPELVLLLLLLVWEWRGWTSPDSPCSRHLARNRTVKTRVPTREKSLMSTRLSVLAANGKRQRRPILPVCLSLDGAALSKATLVCEWSSDSFCLVC